MLSWDYSPHIGGMGRHVSSLTEGLRAAGLRVSVLSGAKIRSEAWGRNIGFSFRLPWRLKRWIEEKNIDLLHFHTGPGGILLLTGPGVPVVATANHTYAAQSKIPGERWKKYFTGFERKGFDLARKIICISSDTATSVQHDYAVEPHKIRVITCGFDLEPWIKSDLDLSERGHSVLFVGRPEMRKGWDILTEAWKKVEEEDPGAVLKIAGFEGPDGPKVKFLGRLSDGELRSAVGSCRLVVCPSRLEGFGLVAAEAIAAGTPVVATDVEGLRTVVYHESTGLITGLDRRSLATALLQGLTNDLLWERLHAGCRAERRRFNLENEIEAHLKIYYEVIGFRS